MVNYQKRKPEKYEAIVNSSTDGDYKVYILNDIAGGLASANPKEAMSILKKAKEMYPKSEFQNNIKIQRIVLQLR